mgnify:CR=1 FL=1
MDKAAMPEGKYLASVKLGPKGQIVVPKEVREMFGVRPGDTLLLLADVNRGIALQTFEKADPVFRDVFSDLTFCLCGAISKKSITNKK